MPLPRRRTPHCATATTLDPTIFPQHRHLWGLLGVECCFWGLCAWPSVHGRGKAGMRCTNLVHLGTVAGASGLSASLICKHVSTLEP